MRHVSADRPSSLENSPKKKIHPVSVDLLRDDAGDAGGGGAGGGASTSVDSSDVEIDLRDVSDLKTPDDLNTPEALQDSVFDGELEWDDSELAFDSRQNLAGTQE